MSNTVEIPATPAPRLRELRELPGPRGWPLIGNLLQVDRSRVHSQVEEWARRYGTIFRFQLASRRLVVITDHALVGAMLRDRPDGFRRTARLMQIGSEMGLQGGVFGAEGEVWKRQRRMVMAGFDPRHLRAYFPALVSVSTRLQNRWRKAAAAQRPIDLQPDLMRFTVDAISGLAFGADVNTLESDDEVIQKHLDKIFPALARRMFSALPTWRWWKTAADHEIERSVAAVNTAIQGFVAAARERLANDPARREAPANLLEAMLVAADDAGSGITDVDVSGNVMTMLLAGEDTTANTLAWMICLLHRHPAALARARDEIDRVAGPMSQWTLERFAALPFVEACANETMRLKPVAPMLVLQAAHDTTLADVRVPAGTMVWAAMRADSLKNEHFDDASAFRPERWLDAEAGPRATSANRIAMPFGAGPRVCPGRQLAMLEMKMAMAALLLAFDIDSVATHDGTAPKEKMAFAMGPEPLTMHLRARR